MAIILDEENNVVTVENQPEAKRALFKNISDGNGGAIDEILERLDRIYPGTNAGFISSTGAVQSATADAEVYTDEFPVTPGNKVSVTLKYSQARSMWLAYCLYNASHAFISRTMLVNSVTQSQAVVSFTVPEGAYYCRLTYRSFNDANLTVDTTGQRLFDVQSAGESVVVNGVAILPTATSTRYGLIKLGSGLGLNANGNTTLTPASDAQIKAGSANSVNPIIPSRQNISTFYGLATAAGDTTQAASANEVGNYTDQAKIAIQKMLGVYREWELIKEVTVAEDTDELIIDTDISGQPFTASDLYIRAWLEPSTTAANDFVAAACKVRLSDDTEAYANTPTERYTTGGAATYFEYTAEMIDNVCLMTGIMSTAPNATSTGQAKTSTGRNASVKAITGFKMSRYSSVSTLIPAGSLIRIYGIRK